MRYWRVNPNQARNFVFHSGFSWPYCKNSIWARNDFHRKKMRSMAGIITLVLTLGLTPSSLAAAKVFKNCTELNRAYPGGVALPGAINSGGATKKEPKYNKALYIANKKSDRDKDGIACEK